MYSFKISLEQIRWVLGLFNTIQKTRDFQIASSVKTESVILYCLL